MKTALQLGHELANETQEAITEAIEADRWAVSAAVLRRAAGVVELSRGNIAVVQALLEMADRAERGES